MFRLFWISEGAEDLRQACIFPVIQGSPLPRRRKRFFADDEYVEEWTRDGDSKSCVLTRLTDHSAQDDLLIRHSLFEELIYTLIIGPFLPSINPEVWIFASVFPSVTILRLRV